MTPNNAPRSTNELLPVEFITLAEKICAIANEHGVKMRPYASPEIPHFRALTEIKQRRVIKALEDQLHFFELSAQENIQLDSPQLIWRALKKYGLVPQSDIFDKITSENVVEIYQTDGTSCFKNLNFFRFISIPVEEVFVLPFYQLYSFSFPGYLYFIEIMFRLKMNLLTKTFAPTFNHYVGQEKRGDKAKFRVHLQWASPLERNGEHQALLVVNRSTFVTDDAPVGAIKTS